MVRRGLLVLLALAALAVFGGANALAASEPASPPAAGPPAASPANAPRFGDVYFTDVKAWSASRAWAVGTGGRIVRTTDGGLHWVTQARGLTARQLNGVDFISENRGWVVGARGTILRTTDAGRTWVRQRCGTTKGLEAVDFISKFRGWAVGESGTILRTTTGGKTWSRKAPATNRLYAVTMADATTGWAAGNNWTILRTTNAGRTWVRQASGAYPAFRVVGIDCVDAQTCWVAGYGTGFSSLMGVNGTTDGGTSWGQQYTSDPIYDVDMQSSTVGWAVGSQLYYSGDGATWAMYPTALTYDDLYAVSFADASNGWAVGFFGSGRYIAHTDDAGLSWARQL